MRLACAVAALVTIATPSLTPAAEPQRIVAVGDLHGDYEAWRAIARAARLVDARGRWAGGNAILVQTGDITDRGPDSLRIIRELMQLQRAAPRKGGRVVVLVGNHEAMNMTGDLRYVHPGEYAAFADRRSAERRERAFAALRTRLEAAYRARTPAMSSEAIKAAWMAETPLGKIEHQQAWSPSGELGRWTIANPAVARIGDSLFVHGGISMRYAAMPLEQINRAVAAALAAQDEAPTSIINDEFGPLWYRGLVIRGKAPAAQPGAAPYPTVDQEIAAALAAYDVRRMVVGHTPTPAGIQISNGGRLVRIDTGISRAYGGTLSYLEIVGGTPIARQLARSSAGQRR
ncbi:MAG TPA: metallophosphoesterase [Sphingomicrobium sp.]|nr:metallophosphoesterase [Sphingomicrobium sp.]